MIIISAQKHYTDEKADLVLNEEVKTALPKIVWPDGRRQSMTQKK